MHSVLIMISKGFWIQFIIQLHRDRPYYDYNSLGKLNRWTSCQLCVPTATRLFGTCVPHFWFS